MNLAKQIVEIYHGKEKATEAENYFINTFQKSKIPDKMVELQVNGNQSLMDILVQNKNLSSKSEFRRLVKEGAVTNLGSGEKITDPDFIAKVGQVFKIGKKTFIKIK